MSVQLILRSGTDSGRTLTMLGRMALLGSAEDCTLRIRDRGVAAHHCALFIISGFLAVRHLASHGETDIGNTAIHGTRRLQPGDTLGIGPLTIEVQFDPAEFATTVSTPVDGEDESQRPSVDPTENPQAATRIVGVCKSKEQTACPSASDGAARALSQLSRRE